MSKLSVFVYIHDLILRSTVLDILFELLNMNFS